MCPECPNCRQTQVSTHQAGSEQCQELSVVWEGLRLQRPGPGSGEPLSPLTGRLSGLAPRAEEGGGSYWAARSQAWVLTARGPDSQGLASASAEPTLRGPCHALPTPDRRAPSPSPCPTERKPEPRSSKVTAVTSPVGHPGSVVHASTSGEHHPRPPRPLGLTPSGGTRPAAPGQAVRQVHSPPTR